MIVTEKEIDTLWFKATDASIAAGEMFTRYRFAALVAEAERERCAKVCDDMAAQDKTSNYYRVSARAIRGLS